MKQILIILFVSIVLKTKAQTPNWEWARCPLTGNSTTALGEVFDNSTDDLGNNYLIGFYRDTLNFDGDTLICNNGGLLNTFIVKYNSSGNTVWAKTSTGNSNATGQSITADKLGNVYYGGNYQINTLYLDTFSLSYSYAGKNMFLAKNDSSGNIVWAKSFASTGNIVVNDLATDKFGNLYATGYFDAATVNFDSLVLTNTDTVQHTGDYFLLKLDPNGNCLWVKKGLGIGLERGEKVMLDSNDNVYVSGIFSSLRFIFGTDTLLNHSPNNTSDIFLLKYDNNGNLIWEKSTGGTDNEYIAGLNVNPLGETLITGWYSSQHINFANSTLNLVAPENTLILKYNSNGNELWCKSNSSGYVSGRAITTDICGNIFTIGTMLSLTASFDNISLNLSSLNQDDLYMLILNSSGNVIWGAAFNFGGDDMSSIVSDAQGNVYIGGDLVPNQIILGNDTLVNTIGETPFQAKVNFNCIVGIPETNNKLEATLFPNPFHDKLSISLNTILESKITLYNLLSGKCFEQKFTKSIEINTSQLSSGMYIYQISNSKNQTYSGKAIKY